MAFFEMLIELKRVESASRQIEDTKLTGVSLNRILASTPTSTRGMLSKACIKPFVACRLAISLRTSV